MYISFSKCVCVCVCINIYTYQLVLVCIYALSPKKRTRYNVHARFLLLKKSRKKDVGLGDTVEGLFYLSFKKDLIVYVFTDAGRKVEQRCHHYVRTSLRTVVPHLSNKSRMNLRHAGLQLQANSTTVGDTKLELKTSYIDTSSELLRYVRICEVVSREVVTFTATDGWCH